RTTSCKLPYLTRSLVSLSLSSSSLSFVLLLFFSFFTIPPHPRSPLFPYTTLFRSCPSCDRELFSEDRFCLVCKQCIYCCNSEHIDRKSTRLNSSHGSISYAVFCLKKKTRNQVNSVQEMS